MSKLLLLLISLFCSFEVFSYESMLRLGYGSCMTCHFSHTGAGLLNDYGKVIAGQLSTFSPRKLPTSKNFYQAVQLRAAHYQSLGQTRTFPMQLDYLTAFQKKNYLIETTLAKAPKDKTKETSFSDEIYMRKALLTLKIDDKKSVQLGRDYLNIGLNLIDHTLFVRRNNKRSVTDFFTLVRGLYQYSHTLQFVTSLYAPSFQESSDNREYGAVLRADKYFSSQRIVTSLSLLKGNTSSIDRNEFAISLKKGWKKLILLGQYSFTQRELKSTQSDFNQKALLFSARAFPLSSVEVYTNFEDLDVDAPFLTQVTRYGHGIRWKPLKNISLEYDAKRNIHTGGSFQSIFQIYFNGWFL